MTGPAMLVGALEATTLGFLVFLLGGRLTRRLRILQEFNIPEPVTGGIAAALVVLGVVLVTGRTVVFDLAIRDYLLILFFSAIGLNARLKDVARGGWPLAVLAVLTVAFMFLQNVLGSLVAVTAGLPAQVGVLLGSASLAGGHGTTIAWAPEIARLTGFSSAMELGIASATLGLVTAALLGGPLAKVLIQRNRLSAADPQAAGSGDAGLGIGYSEEADVRISPSDLTRTMLVLHVVILIGATLHQAIGAAGLTLPLFVPCMLVAIAIGNLLPLVRAIPPVSHRPALALVSDFALGTFLAMSLMSMQLWELQGFGVLMAVSIAGQTLMIVAFVLFVFFRLMGGTYTAAILSAGFVGFAMGATPTAIANMNAVTKAYGPAPMAFVILPLVSAFLADLSNTALIQLFLFF
jgi:glutamate:Na+ symporter, ESS family